ALSRSRRCLATPKRDISVLWLTIASSSPSGRPSRSKSASRSRRRVGSASALNTRSSSGTHGQYVTFWSRVNGGLERERVAVGSDRFLPLTRQGEGERVRAAVGSHRLLPLTDVSARRPTPHGSGGRPPAVASSAGSR